MTGVTWRPLPPDAPEPPPLSVVREEDGDLWVRGIPGAGHASWWCIGGGTSDEGTAAGEDCAWGDIDRPLEISEPALLVEGLPALPPLRTDGLTAAVEIIKMLRAPSIHEVERVLRAVYPFTVSADEDGA